MLCIRCWYQHLFRCQSIRNGCGTVALASQTEYFTDNLCGRLVHDKGLLVVRLSLVAVGNRTAAPHSVFHSGLEYRLDFVAGVLCVPLVHDVQKRREVIVLRGGAVHIVVDSDEANVQERKHTADVVADHEIITPETGKVFDYDAIYLSLFDLFHHSEEIRSFKVLTTPAVVTKLGDFPTSELRSAADEMLQQTSLIGYPFGFRGARIF